ncbi:MAG: hypothetical protein G3I10_11385, partial [Ferrovum sp.]|nr:hypothetical protein [Ferrovum sp.]
MANGITHVLGYAIPRLMLLLNEGYFWEAQVQQAFYVADSACPACTYANRSVGKHVGHLTRQLSDKVGQAGLRQLDTLCVWHFQALAAQLPAELRLDVLTQYANEMEQAARTMRALLQTSRETDAWLFDGKAETLHQALGLAAGLPPVSAPPLDGGLTGPLELCPTLVEGISFPQACPLCIETERARQHWLQNVRRAARYNQGVWLFFPTCPEHVWAVAALGEPKLTVAVVLRALSVSLR